MTYRIPEKLKPLVADIKESKIKYYLSSEKYTNELLRNNFDEVWNRQAQSLIRLDGRASQLDIFIYTLKYLWDNYVFLSNENDFTRFVKITLIGYINSDHFESIANIINELKKLNFSKRDVEDIRTLNMAKSLIKNIVAKPINKAEDVKVKANTAKKSNTCFVIIPFHTDFDPVFSIIETSVNNFNNTGLMALRAKDFFQPQPFMKTIFEETKKSFCVIADVTNKNVNVFYELGLAHALGKPVIIISQSINDIPADLKHHNIILYDNTLAGTNKLIKELKNQMTSLISSPEKFANVFA